MGAVSEGTCGDFVEQKRNHESAAMTAPGKTFVWRALRQQAGVLSTAVVAAMLLSGAGCRESEPPSNSTDGEQLAGRPPTEPLQPNGVSDAGGESVGSAADDAASPSVYESKIRFRELPVDVFPTVIPTNGEPHNYSTILESLGSGCAVIDVDRDGWPDCVVAGGGDFDGNQCVAQPVFLARNLRDRFELCDGAAGLADTQFYNHGLAATDYDHDGFADLLLTGFGGIQLFRNLGDGTFETVHNTGMDCPQWSVSAAWGDFNADGHLDVYVANYVDWSFENDPPCFAADSVTRDNCSPIRFQPLPDCLFLNSGDGSFTDATTEFGVCADGKGLGVVAADIDQDGFTDVYVGNDVMVNFLYQNDGGKTFKDLSLPSGAGVSHRGTPDASMGVDVADFDMDGLPDLWAANFELENFAMYRHQGKMQFRHSSDITGVSAIGSRYVGWGSLFMDLDLDSDLDMTVCNGHVVKHPAHAPVQQPMILLENIDGDYFEQVAAQAGSAISKPRNGRGLAAIDWNRDGRPDFLITPVNERAELLENQTMADGSWLAVTLVGTSSPRLPIGAEVRLTTSDGAILQRQQKGGGSYASTSTSTLMFGLPAGTTAESLSIRWPNGGFQTTSSPELNAHLVIAEPTDGVMPVKEFQPAAIPR
mgnify:CR=1 FL=1